MYVKLFGSILDSSIWSEDQATRLVWITMLAMGDEDGLIHAAMPGLAKRAGVSIEEAKRAVDILGAPDPESRSPEYEGRRIEKVDGGWRLLNYEKYRQIRTREQLQSARRMQKYRAKQQRNSDGSSVTDSATDSNTDDGNAALASTSVGSSGVGVQGKGTAVVEASEPEPWEAVALKLRDRINGKQSDLEAGGKLVLSYFNAVMSREFRWGGDSRSKILARLRETGNVSDLFYVVDGATKDDWIMGRDAKNPKGYKQPVTVFRDAGQVDKFLANVRDRAAVHPTLNEMLEAASHA